MGNKDSRRNGLCSIFRYNVKTGHIEQPTISEVCTPVKNSWQAVKKETRRNATDGIGNVFLKGATIVQLNVIQVTALMKRVIELKVKMDRILLIEVTVTINKK